MAGSRDMTLQVIVKLRDELARGLDGALGKINAWSHRAKGLFDRVGAGIGALSAKFGALGIGAGLGLKVGLDSFVRMDAVVRDIGITLGKSGRELERFTKNGIKDLEKLALTTGQTSETLAGIWMTLSKEGGLSEEAQKALISPIGKAATAAGADPTDMAKVVAALYKNAGIKDPAKIELAIAHLIQAGKLGAVELKDMARDLPSILASQANLGLTGLAAVDTAGASIEISKNTTGTPGEAATNYRDFLAGINAPHTRKRFADHGVDLPGVLRDAAAKGINPVDAVLQKVSKIIDQPKVVEQAIKRAKGKGLDQTRTLAEITQAVDMAVKSAGLGELFVNQQTLGYLIARQLGKAQYKEMMATLGATGVSITETDQASRMASPEAKRLMAGEKTEQLGRRAGSAVSWIFDAASSVADAFRKVVDAADALSPKIVDLGVNIVALGSLILTVVGALRWLGFGKKALGAAATVAETVVEGGATAAKATAGAGIAFADVVANAIGSALGSALGGGRSMPIFDDLAAAARRAADALGDLANRAASITGGAPRMDFQTGGGFGTEGPSLGPGPRSGGFQTEGGFGGDGYPSAPPPQKVEVDTTVTVKVEGPGVVTSTQTTSKPVDGGDRGQTVGRP